MLGLIEGNMDAVIRHIQISHMHMAFEKEVRLLLPVVQPATCPPHIPSIV
jgi:hypothetical protein